MDNLLLIGWRTRTAYRSQDKLVKKTLFQNTKTTFNSHYDFTYGSILVVEKFLPFLKLF